MRILLLGKNGQVGWELARSLAPFYDVIAPERNRVDLSQPDTVIDFARSTCPNIIINAAAYTDVDRAEDDPDTAILINASVSGILAEEAKKSGAVFIHYSTNYVFDGNKNKPYLETDAPNPLGIYGRGKLIGEQNIQSANCNYFIFRTSWIYSQRRENFLTKVLRWARSKKSLHIVNDQFGNPTWAQMLAKTTSALIAQMPPDILAWVAERKGIYHLAGKGYTSRYLWAKQILEFIPHSQKQTLPSIFPATTAEYPAAAKRPLFSALDSSKFTQTFGMAIPHWTRSLRLAMRNSNTH